MKKIVVVVVVVNSSSKWSLFVPIVHDDDSMGKSSQRPTILLFTA